MATKRKSTAKPKNRSTARRAARKGVQTTKTGVIIDLLKRPKGASIAQMQNATSWQPHSVRAALTGLRKKGFDVHRAKDAKEVTVYSVAKASQ